MGLFDTILSNEKFKNMALQQLAKVFDSGKCEAILLKKNEETGLVQALIFEPGETFAIEDGKFGYSIGKDHQEIEMPETTRIILLLKSESNADIDAPNTGEPTTDTGASGGGK